MSYDILIVYVVVILKHCILHVQYMCISYSLYSFMIVFPNIKILVVSVVLFHHFAILIVFIFVVFMFIVLISCSVFKLLQNFTMMNMRI